MGTVIPVTLAQETQLEAILFGIVYLEAIGLMGLLAEELSPLHADLLQIVLVAVTETVTMTRMYLTTETVIVSGLSQDEKRRQKGYQRRSIICASGDKISSIFFSMLTSLYYVLCQRFCL